MMTHHDINLMINWLLHAVLGAMAQADVITRMDPGALARVARVLRQRHGLPRRPLYRGLLLANASVDLVGPDPRTGRTLPWWSWSEDRDVARWFASPESYISEPFREYAPEARGYVLTLDRIAPEHVLWHHSWRHAFGVPLEQLALAHPYLGREAARQIAWSLDTQREVITAPLPTLPTPEPVGNVPGATVAALDARLTPSWIS